MENLPVFRLQIIKYALIAAVISEAGSLPLLGFNPAYLCGLLTGTCVSIISFLVLLFMSERVLSSGVKWMASLGYLLRLPIYGAAFYLCMKAGGLHAGVGCLIGFLATVLAMIYVHGIKSKLSISRKRNDRE